MGNTGLLRLEAEMSRTVEFTILAFLPVQVSTSQGGRRLPPQQRHV